MSTISGKLFENKFAGTLKDSTFYDILLKIGKKEYKCHKIILASNSKYFEGLFNDLKKDENGISSTDLKVHEDISEKVFEEVLDFLYSGECKISSETMIGLSLAATEFKLSSMQEAIKNHLNANEPNLHGIFQILDDAVKSLKEDDYLLKSAANLLTKKFDQVDEKELEKRFDTYSAETFINILGQDNFNQSKETKEKWNRLLQKVVEKFDIENKENLVKKLIGNVCKGNMPNGNFCTNFIGICSKNKGFEKEAELVGACLGKSFLDVQKEETKILKFKPNVFCSILRCDELAVKSEDYVLELALKYLKANDSISEKEKRDVMESVRIAQLSTTKLTEIQVKPPPFLDQKFINLSIVGKLQTIENPSVAIDVSLYPYPTYLKIRKKKIFTHVSDFDKNGILYYLGTNYGSEAYKVPSHRSTITLKANHTFETGNVNDMISWTACKCNMNNKQGNTLTITFNTLTVCANKYTIRQTLSRDTEAPRNWEILGSVDGTNFDTLIKHVNEDALKVKGGTASFALPGKKYYKCFRIHQYGANSSNNHYLSMAGFELYGRIEDN